ncbi:hypothetical protein [Phaffia rhodozyma]|uniref:Uncharacterized protein n=1 Tax=Phaffia rhodozyma TaxID=264483 RepID=A0A0F7SUM1_PHARH|nr:hypothetical protein [Phaffia rhodozyma]
MSAPLKNAVHNIEEAFTGKSGNANVSQSGATGTTGSDVNSGVHTSRTSEPIPRLTEQGALHSSDTTDNKRIGTDAANRLDNPHTAAGIQGSHSTGAFDSRTGTQTGSHLPSTTSSSANPLSSQTGHSSHTASSTAAGVVPGATGHHSHEHSHVPGQTGLVGSTGDHTHQRSQVPGQTGLVGSVGDHPHQHTGSALPLETGLPLGPPIVEVSGVSSGLGHSHTSHTSHTSNTSHNLRDGAIGAGVGAGVAADTVHSHGVSGTHGAYDTRGLPGAQGVSGAHGISETSTGSSLKDEALHRGSQHTGSATGSGLTGVGTGSAAAAAGAAGIAGAGHHGAEGAHDSKLARAEDKLENRAAAHSGTETGAQVGEHDAHTQFDEHGVRWIRDKEGHPFDATHSTAPKATGTTEAGSVTDATHADEHAGVATGEHDAAHKASLAEKVKAAVGLGH